MCICLLVHVCLHASVCVYMCKGAGVWHGAAEMVLITWKAGALHIWKGLGLNLSSIAYSYPPGLLLGPLLFGIPQLKTILT